MALGDYADKIQRLYELPEDQLREVTDIAARIAAIDMMNAAQDKFIPFVKAMWPQFIEGAHHRIMANAFERVAQGKLKRLIINMPPRHTKSEFASHMFPAWFLGQFPEKKVIQASHTAELSKSFGRKVRDLVSSPEYQTVFPGVKLKKDSTSAARWDTNKGGQYFAIGTGGNIAGKGADVFIIDDSVSEQEGKSGDPKKFDDVYDWYETGPRQRLQPNAAIVIIETRWNAADLTGRVTKRAAEREGVDNWEVIEFPAILPSGKALWPGYWSLEELLKIKAEIQPFRWNAQYMQAPTSDEAAIVKRTWWKKWTESKPPDCSYIIQSWDTAFTKTTRSDYSACTTWGVFHQGRVANLILLDAYRGRLEFPELKEKAFQLYNQYKPDSLVIETRAAGWPLIFELRERGVYPNDYTPSRGEDKYVRVNAVSDMFKSGVIWAPELEFSDDVIEEFSDFPRGENDDLVDSSTQALMRFRQGGFIPLESDTFGSDAHVPINADYY